MDFLLFQTGTDPYGMTLYIDSIGYSWDLDYSIGQNMNEGLLLTYYNNTTLNWQGYSLDGASNKTILGNTTIPIPTNGKHHIQVFGNDSIGENLKSIVLYLTYLSFLPFNILISVAMLPHFKLPFLVRI